MEKHIEKQIFTSAATEDEELAIQTCPYYDEALSQALDNSYEDYSLADSETNCPKNAFCKVLLMFNSHINQLTIYGRCLME